MSDYNQLKIKEDIPVPRGGLGALRKKKMANQETTITTNQDEPINVAPQLIIPEEPGVIEENEQGLISQPLLTNNFQTLSTLTTIEGELTYYNPELNNRKKGFYSKFAKTIQKYNPEVNTFDSIISASGYEGKAGAPIYTVIALSKLAQHFKDRKLGKEQEFAGKIKTILDTRTINTNYTSEDMRNGLYPFMMVKRKTEALSTYYRKERILCTNRPIYDGTEKTNINIPKPGIADSYAYMYVMSLCPLITYSDNSVKINYLKNYLMNPGIQPIQHITNDMEELVNINLTDTENIFNFCNVYLSPKFAAKVAGVFDESGYTISPENYTNNLVGWVNNIVEVLKLNPKSYSDYFITTPKIPSLNVTKFHDVESVSRDPSKTITPSQNIKEGLSSISIPILTAFEKLNGSLGAAFESLAITDNLRRIVMNNYAGTGDGVGQIRRLNLVYEKFHENLNNRMNFFSGDVSLMLNTHLQSAQEYFKLYLRKPISKPNWVTLIEGKNPSLWIEQVSIKVRVNIEDLTPLQKEFVSYDEDNNPVLDRSIYKFKTTDFSTGAGFPYIKYNKGEAYMDVVESSDKIYEMIKDGLKLGLTENEIYSTVIESYPELLYLAGKTKLEVYSFAKHVIPDDSINNFIEENHTQDKVRTFWNNSFLATNFNQFIGSLITSEYTSAFDIQVTTDGVIECEGLYRAIIPFKGFNPCGGSIDLLFRRVQFQTPFRNLFTEIGDYLLAGYSDNAYISGCLEEDFEIDSSLLVSDEKYSQRNTTIKAGTRVFVSLDGAKMESSSTTEDCNINTRLNLQNVGINKEDNPDLFHFLEMTGRCATAGGYTVINNQVFYTPFNQSGSHNTFLNNDIKLYTILKYYDHIYKHKTNKVNIKNFIDIAASLGVTLTVERVTLLPPINYPAFTQENYEYKVDLLGFSVMKIPVSESYHNDNEYTLIVPILEDDRRYKAMCFDKYGDANSFDMHQICAKCLSLIYAGSYLIEAELRGLTELMVSIPNWLQSFSGFDGELAAAGLTASDINIKYTTLSRLFQNYTDAPTDSKGIHFNNLIKYFKEVCLLLYTPDSRGVLLTTTENGGSMTIMEDMPEEPNAARSLSLIDIYGDIKDLKEVQPKLHLDLLLIAHGRAEGYDIQFETLRSPSTIIIKGLKFSNGIDAILIKKLRIAALERRMLSYARMRLAKIIREDPELSIHHKKLLEMTANYEKLRTIEIQQARIKRKEEKLAMKLTKEELIKTINTMNDADVTQAENDYLHLNLKNQNKQFKVVSYASKNLKLSEKKSKEFDTVEQYEAHLRHLKKINTINQERNSRKELREAEKKIITNWVILDAGIMESNFDSMDRKSLNAKLKSTEDFFRPKLSIIVEYVRSKNLAQLKTLKTEEFKLSYQESSTYSIKELDTLDFINNNFVSLDVPETIKHFMQFQPMIPSIRVEEHGDVELKDGTNITFKFKNHNNILKPFLKSIFNGLKTEPLINELLVNIKNDPNLDLISLVRILSTSLYFITLFHNGLKLSIIQNDKKRTLTQNPNAASIVLIVAFIRIQKSVAKTS